MNLIILFKEDYIENTNKVILTGRRLEHILNIHKSEEGESLIVGNLNGKIGKGTITKINNDCLEMDVKLREEPPMPTKALLILALPRPLMLKRIIMHVCTLGIKEIHLLNTKRVEKSFWQSPVLKEENIFKELILGLEQAKDTILPSVKFHKNFKNFIEKESIEIIKNKKAFVAHPIAESEYKFSIEEETAVAIGPEGGFIDYEIEKFIEAGFIPIKLGKRILRVETAVPVILSRIIHSI